VARGLRSNNTLRHTDLLFPLILCYNLSTDYGLREQKTVNRKLKQRY